MNTLQQYYAGVLAELINAKNDKAKAKADDIASIMKGMAVLAETSDEVDGTGVVTTTAWIPLKYKRMLFYALYGSAKIKKTVIEMQKNEWAKAVCTISGTLDGVEYEYSVEATQPYSITEAFAGLSEDGRNARMVGYALAKAEKIALYNAGICMDFTGDVDEPTIPAGNDQLPEEPVSEDIVKAMQEALAVEKKDAEPTDTSDVPKEVKTPATESNKKTKKKADDKAKSLSEDLIIPIGPKKGDKLSNADSKYLAWILNQIDCENIKVSDDYYEIVKDLVMSDEKATRIYESKGTISA